MTDNPLSPDDASRIVMLVFGTMEHGGQYWVYVAVKPSRHEEFAAAIASKHYNIQKFPEDGFGEVIVSGEGGLPPRNVTRQIAEMFNIPIRQLFADQNPQLSIAKGIEALKAGQTNA